MKLLAENSSTLKSHIDQNCKAETSVVCRYRDAVQLDDDPDNDLALKQYLRETSISEGARIVHLMTYKDVEIHIMDETSRMATGTLKSIDGCLTTAFCCMEGIERIAFESGGNTGSSLTRYGQKAGLETFFFCPLDNIDLLDSSLFQNQSAHLVGVEDRTRVKEFTGLFVRSTNIRHVPEKSWRNAASMFRGLFILEQMLSAAGKYDWLIQAVSAGFGPIGIYNVLQAFQAEIAELPRFLGIQQEANCPAFKAWKSDIADGGKSDSKKEKKLLTRVMYDDSPQTYKTFEDLLELLVKMHGDMVTVNKEEFDSYLLPPGKHDDILGLLRSQDIAISLRSGDILEKTGLIALAGTLKAIDNEIIKPGCNVLCFLTSGVSEADGLARPEKIIRNEQDVLQYIEEIPGGK